MLTKNRLQGTLNGFPEYFTLEEFMDKVMLLDKIEHANKQSLNKELISESDLEKEIEKWFK